MSVHRLPLIFAPEANDDLIDIQVYTELTYGATQWTIYRGKLDRAFALLSEHPHSGSPRPELPRDILVFPVEKHRIFYRIRPDAVHVARILHSSMDARRHL
jgi:toxin ParE1/3/4